jgi:hypothetical protein
MLNEFSKSGLLGLTDILIGALVPLTPPNAPYPSISSFFYLEGFNWGLLSLARDSGVPFVFSKSN